MNMAMVKEDGITIDAANYKCVYSGRLHENEKLDDLYAIFNDNPPADYKACLLYTSFRMRKSLKTKILKKMKNKYTFLAEGAVKHALSVSLYEGGNTSNTVLMMSNGRCYPNYLPMKTIRFGRRCFTVYP